MKGDLANANLPKQQPESLTVIFSQKTLQFCLSIKNALLLQFSHRVLVEKLQNGFLEKHVDEGGEGCHASDDSADVDQELVEGFFDSCFSHGHGGEVIAAKNKIRNPNRKD